MPDAVSSRDGVPVGPACAQILAHHPDFPERVDVAQQGAAAYQPFARMLQFALEPLCLAACTAADGDAPGACSSLVSPHIHCQPHLVIFALAFL